MSLPLLSAAIRFPSLKSLDESVASAIRSASQNRSTKEKKLAIVSIARNMRGMYLIVK